MADEQVGETPNPAATGEMPAKQNAEELAAQLASAEKRIKELNAESAKHRKTAEALAKAEEERKTAEMSETDKLKAKLDAAEKAQAELLQKANARIVRAEILAKAAGRFIDPEDVVIALRDKLTVGDDGAVGGIDDALKELEKAKPHWVKKAPAMGVTNPGEANTGETIEQRKARLFGGGGQIFDPRADGVIFGKT